MKNISNHLLLFLAFLLISAGAVAGSKPYYYQLKIYHLQSKTQEDRIDAYLRNAYLPALHRSGIASVGVFKPVVTDTLDRLVYVFIPFKKFDGVLVLESALKKDQQYQADGKDYIDAPYDQLPYNRIESILLEAFSAMPAPKVPALTAPKNERIYELRSYEGPTEKLSLNKIGMFNDKEMAIFTMLNFNAVFYGRVLSGTRMPNMMYLTTFNNKEDRDKHWKDFGPEYKKISGLPEYQHNNLRSVVTFVRPAEYSDY